MKGILFEGIYIILIGNFINNRISRNPKKICKNENGGSFINDPFLKPSDNDFCNIQRGLYFLTRLHNSEIDYSQLYESPHSFL